MDCQNGDIILWVTGLENKCHLLNVFGTLVHGKGNQQTLIHNDNTL